MTKGFGFFLNTTRTCLILLRPDPLPLRLGALSQESDTQRIRAQQNKAGSGGIQEECADIDGHNVFSAYAPGGSSKVWGMKHE